MTAALRRIVIVGNGIAGVTAAETLRREGFAGELTIVGEEAHAPYSRPALSKAALLDEAEMVSHVLPPSEHGATTRLSCAAVGLDPEARVVRLADGDELPYDGLVIASGSHARRLSDSANELTLRGLDDAERLRARVTDRPDVLVLGGGPLGMEVASGCTALGCRVTLVTRRTPMLGLLGGALADALTAAATEAGVRIHTGTPVSLRDTPEGATVTLADSTELSAPLVVSALGDDANVEWLATSGLLRDGELRVDARGRVAPGIVAAGDVATLPTARGWERLPLWTSAIEQAKVAAVALLRGDDAPELDFQSYFWTEQFGISVKVCGELPVDADPEVVDGSLAERHALLRWEHPDDTATAAAVGYRIPVPRLRALTRPRETAAA